MAIPFYLSALTISQNPSESLKSDYQQTTLNMIDSASTYKTIKEQQVVGTQNYLDINCRITSLIDPKTGKNFGDQFRKVIFDDVDHTKWLGQMYEFDSHTWLSVNTSTRIGASSHSVLRQCNNFLKWVGNDGLIKKYPCVFSRDLSADSMVYGSAGTPQIWGKSLIQVQRNEDTNQIKFNDRLIFDGIAFQVQQINNHISNTYLELYIFETQVQGTDDLSNDVANGNNYAPTTGTEIKILPVVSSIIKNQSETFSVYKYINGDMSLDTFTITVTGGLPGDYSLNIIDGNNFTITCINASENILEIVCVDNISGESINMFIKLTGTW